MGSQSLTLVSLGHRRGSQSQCCEEALREHPCPHLPPARHASLDCSAQHPLLAPSTSVPPLPRIPCVLRGALGHLPPGRGAQSQALEPPAWPIAGVVHHPGGPGTLLEGLWGCPALPYPPLPPPRGWEAGLLSSLGSHGMTGADPDEEALGICTLSLPVPGCHISIGAGRKGSGQCHRAAGVIGRVAA